MVNLVPATTYVLGDEKALALAEVNDKSPDGLHRRYQVIWVVRDDKMTEYREDIGAVTEQPPFRIPSYMEHTVNELREMANQLKQPMFDNLELLQIDKIKTWDTGTCFAIEETKEDTK